MGYVLLTKDDRTRSRRKKATDDVKQGRFARAIRPYQAHNFTFIHLEGDTVQGAQATKILSDLVNLK